MYAHKFSVIANITNVFKIYAVTITALFLIFPFILNLRFIYDKNYKKLFFSAHIYGISILGGYIERIREGFAIHVSENKALILPYRSLIGMRSNFNLRKNYFIRKINLLTELGSEDLPQLPFMFAVASNIASNIYGALRKSAEGNTIFKSDVLLYEEKNVLKISAEIEVVFNIFTILITFFKLFLRKIEKWITKTK